MQADLMNYFVIEYKGGGRGCPGYLKGDLNFDLEWDPLDPNIEKICPTKKYEFRAKHSLIELDFWDGLLCSDRFLDLCVDYGMNLKRVPVRMIQSNGSVAGKTYSYVLTSDYISILDEANSEYLDAISLESGLPVRDRYFGEYTRKEKITKFKISPDKAGGRDVFRCLDIDDKFVCSERFRNACQEHGLLGMDFISIDEGFKVVPFWLED